MKMNHELYQAQINQFYSYLNLNEDQVKVHQQQTTNFLEVPSDHIGPKRLVVGKTVCQKIEITLEEQQVITLWLPASDRKGLFWWGGEKRVLPHIRLVDYTDASKGDVTKINNRTNNLQNELEDYLDQNEEDEDEETEGNRLFTHNPLFSKSDDQTHQISTEIRSFKLTSPQKLLQHFFERYQAIESNRQHTIKTDRPFLKRKLSAFFQFLVTGGSNGMPLLIPTDSDSHFGQRVAQDRVITVELKGFPPMLRSQLWGPEARKRESDFCDLHTPGNSNAGLTRHLKHKTQQHKDSPINLGLAALNIPHWHLNEPRRLLLACGHLTHAEPLHNPEEPPSPHDSETANSTPVDEVVQSALLEPPGVHLYTAFSFWGGWNHEDAIVISASAARKLALAREAIFSYPVPWAAEIPKIEKGDFFNRGDKVRAKVTWYPIDFKPESLNFMSPKEAWEGQFYISLDGRKVPWPAEVKKVTTVRFDKEYKPETWKDIPRPNSVRAVMDLHLEERQRSAQRGDKMFNQHGNKGVIAKIIPDKEMPYLRHQDKKIYAEVIVNPFGVINRGNFAQLQEAIDSWKDYSPCDPDSGRVSLTLDHPSQEEIHFEAIFGQNLWMRSLHEAARQSKICSTKQDSLPNALHVAKGTKMRATGLKYGELNAWALGVRKNARHFVEEVLLKRSEASYGQQSDHQHRVTAWRWLLWHTLGFNSQNHAFTSRQTIESKLTESEIRQLNRESDTTSDHHLYTKAKLHSLKRKTNKKSEDGTIQYSTLLWLEERVSQTLNFNDSKSRLSVLQRYSEVLMTSKQFASTRHLQTQINIKKDPRHDMLRRSPLVEWPLCLQVGRSYRGVIVPAPDLAMDRVELPWWVALHLFWDDLSELQQKRWIHAFKDFDKGLIGQILEGLQPTWRPNEDQNQEHEPAPPNTVLTIDQQLAADDLVVLQDQLKSAWVVIHRDPILHYGSLWTMQVSISPLTDCVIGFPPQSLTPIGGDYDGDTIGIVPVGIIDQGQAQLHQFCVQNAPLVRSESSTDIRLFNTTDLDIPADLFGDELADENMFPLDKDLRLAYNLLGQPDRQYLQAGDMESVQIDMFDYNKVLCKSWTDNKTQYLEKTRLTSEQLDHLKDSAVPNDKQEECVEEAELIFKTEHLAAQDKWWTATQPSDVGTNEANNNTEENTETKKDYLDTLPLFFYESQRGAGLVGGLYRRILHTHIPEDLDKQRIFIVALQRQMERLQQTVLKFKKNKKPIKAQSLNAAWKSALEGKGESWLSLPELPQEKDFVKTLVQETRQNSFQLIQKYKHDDNPHSRLWLKGELAQEGIKIDLNPSDPRYLFILEPDTLELDPQWEPLKLLKK